MIRISIGISFNYMNYQSGETIMEIKQLKTFLTVSKTLSFSKTASILNFAQSSISDQIKSLEKELDCKLFERLGRNITLSKEGKKLLEYALPILNLEEEAKQVLKQDNLPSGTLTIATAETLGVYLLPELFTQYAKSYPEVELKIIVGKCEEFEDWLKSNKVDIAFTFDYNAIHQEFICKTLQHIPLVLISNQEHYSDTTKKMDLFHLNGKNLILTQKECSYRRHLEELLNSVHVTPKSIMNMESIEAIKQYVKSGFGVSFLPKIAVEKELYTKELMSWSYRGFNYSSIAQSMYHKDKWLSPALKALLKMTDEYFDHKIKEEINVKVTSK